MKVIIIEGPDNTGKSTLINQILEKYNVVKIYHCNKPTSSNPFAEQCELFGTYVIDTIKTYNEGLEDAIIFNRFYQGEYVYGQMYRNGNPNSIKQMISILEDKLINNIKEEDLIYIQVYSSSTNLMWKYDDGLSLSEGDAHKISKEMSLFKEIFDFSKIKNKYLLKVNNNEIFRTKTDIINEFNSYINE